jgi:hypothetical protein
LDGTPFILIRRKGWHNYKWEKVISIPDYPEISPWHLMVKYVNLTQRQGKPGGPLILSLKSPFEALSANRLGSLTKRILEFHGIHTEVWGSHSTRGAGVQLYKELGLSSEEVCEIGQWKNVQAFSSHYLRLGADKKASSLIYELVHKISHGDCAEPDMSRTPRKNYFVQGGRDMEGEAQEPCEILPQGGGVRRGNEFPEGVVCPSVLKFKIHHSIQHVYFRCK